MRRYGHTIGVPYDPETAKGVSPNPTGGGDPKKTAWVTFIPIPKPKSIPCPTMSISKLMIQRKEPQR